MVDRVHLWNLESKNLAKNPGAQIVVSTWTQTGKAHSALH